MGGSLTIEAVPTDVRARALHGVFVNSFIGKLRFPWCLP